MPFKQIEDEVYSCILEESNTPRYTLIVKDFKDLAFPDMLPSRLQGYDSPQPSQNYH